MTETFDKEKILECMFDPQTSEILLELQNNEKELDYLIQQLGLTEDIIRNKLSYLLEHNFVFEIKKQEKTIFKVNAKKLDSIIESDKNYDGVVDGLTELDSYLN